MTCGFVYDDGGRAMAGFKGQAGDCVVRAIAIVLQKPYREVYNLLNDLSKNAHLGWELVKNRYGYKYEKVSSSRTGVAKKIYHTYLLSLGLKWIPTMQIGSGCKIHLKADELPAGRIICNISKHLVAVIDGIIHDTYDCSRNGTRCVYGYYSF